MKIFGREPTLWIALITALVSMAGTLGFRLLGDEQAALWNVAILAVAGAANAYFVRPLSPAVFTYAVAALAQLGAGYGLELTAPQLSLLQGLTVSALALMTREAVSPITTAATNITEKPLPAAVKAEAAADAKP